MNRDFNSLIFRKYRHSHYTLALCQMILFLEYKDGHTRGNPVAQQVQQHVVMTRNRCVWSWWYCNHKGLVGFKAKFETRDLSKDVANRLWVQCRRGHTRWFLIMATCCSTGSPSVWQALMFCIYSVCVTSL